MQFVCVSEQMLELQERQRVMEAEQVQLAAEAHAALGERDEALRLHRLMMDAADLGDRTRSALTQDRDQGGIAVPVSCAMLRARVWCGMHVQCGPGARDCGGQGVHR